MQDFEKLGVFYLGRLYDREAKAPRPDPLLYDAKDLTTHAVCLGMTGSGKTGLCLALLEEAAIDGIPAIAIDPKGDLGNLLLAFPSLQPWDFLPWVDPQEAERQGCTVEQHAAQIAERWRNGLAESGQTPDRISRYRGAVEIDIFTPGSHAGRPLTVLRSFAAPPPAVLADADALRQRTLSAVSGLLSLAGADADPLRSREHILLSNLLDRAWREGRSPDMAAVIREIQSPPFERIGVMDLESIFPASDRYAFAVQLNNLLASPGFSAWTEGEPLDAQRLLYTAAGRPRLSILSIAHLSDRERMFFVTSLLNELLAWMRSQPGTTSLRAVLYMDEVFGYFPPAANPPSKTPMLTLLKQARAYGLGVVLATQNPVDLDYKGLSNAGTWFLGRLQTERDKARVLDGLEGASASAGRQFDRRRMETILSGLGNRVFLLNNVHEDEPVIFQSRWTLSYLRGPLTREQIEKLMQSRKAAARAAEPLSRVRPGAAPGAPRSSGPRPVLPPEIHERCLRPTHPASAGQTIVYRPALLGLARVHFVKTPDVDLWESLALLSLVGDAPPEDIWAESVRLESGAVEFTAELPEEPLFAPLAAELAQPKNYARWTAALKNHLYQSHCLPLHECPALKVRSRPGESEADFRIRVRQKAAELRDQEIEKLRKRYAPPLQTLQERRRQAEQRVQREKAQMQQQGWQTALSVGASLLGALLGRKLATATNVTRAASSLRQAGRMAREKGDVDQAEESLESLDQRLADLDSALQEEIARLREQFSDEKLPIVSAPLRPRKSDLAVEQVTLVWTPWFVDAAGIVRRAF